MERQLVRELGVRCSSITQVIGMINGTSSVVREQCSLRLKVGGKLVTLDAVVVEALVAGCDFLLGVDGIDALGGVSVYRGAARFGGDGSELCSGHVEQAVTAAAGVGVEQSAAEARQGEVSLSVEEDDFLAVFDGERWVVQWKWEDKPLKLRNQRAGYRISDGNRGGFEAEVEAWIREGVLIPYDERVHGEAKGLIPLMAVAQPNKAKVRPVLDYRELNSYIKSNPGADVDVCGEKLREWRKRGDGVEMLDLRKAYLQLHISEELQCYQTVQFNGRTYVLTRLGFGLASAPKIMSKVLGKVLSLREDVRAGTDSYIDDIMVDTKVVSSATVRLHLERFGLVAKDPVPLKDARVLGLRVYSQNKGGELEWKRDNSLPEVGSPLTKREVFSVCGQLVSHYPVAGWLRVWCSYIKRLASGGEWDCGVPSGVGPVLQETLERLAMEDPVHGVWGVPGEASGKVWCDASSLALGVCLELGGHVVEDASWLRKQNDGAHINVARLDAVLKGVNMGIRWGLRNIALLTDSAAVSGWVSSVIRNAKRPKVSGLGEMLVRRRLGMLAELISAYELTVSILLVPSCQNKADVLTRVPKKWLRGARVYQEGNVVCAGEIVGGDGLSETAVRRSHERHHLGVRRTLFLAKMELGDEVERSVVQKVVQECDRCRMIDPASVRWEKGSLGVEATWSRVAVDITHYEGSPYLTLVDCGPGRFAIWRKLRDETGKEVATHMELTFRERGLPQELISDNGPCFRSGVFSELLSKLGVQHLLSCAYRASGNGIVERNHRTVKRMAARVRGDVRDMVMFYNASPNGSGIIPAEAIYKYAVAIPGLSCRVQKSHTVTPVTCPFVPGDLVYVRPPNARCTTSWDLKTVSGINSDVSVMVDGVPRHVRDLRKALIDSELTRGGSCEQRETRVEFDSVTDCDEESVEGSESSDSSSNAEDVNEEPRRPVRDRHPPGWLRDFNCDV